MSGSWGQSGTSTRSLQSIDADVTLLHSVLQAAVMATRMSATSTPDVVTIEYRTDVALVMASRT